MTDPLLWWQKGIIYQIYPRSFQDSNGDGVGDLAGIHSRLDYVESLGVDAIWLSPIFPSPMADFGYDVADYTDIHPLFGSLSDFDRLLAETHRRGLKLLLDLVPNHTSDEHPWFVESRSSRDNPKRNWYIWVDPKPDGSPPNNWLSFFGGPAWTYDEATGQYYLHQFLSKQPELNYRNPEVLDAMLNSMRFWLDRGVDGFRVDVIWLMIKDESLRDEPEDPNWDRVKPHNRLQHLYTAHVEGIHDIVRAMRGVLDEYDERMMVGEIYLPNDKLMTYYGEQCDLCHLPFNFQLITAPWNARTVKAMVDAYEAALPPGGWPNWVLGNHDQPRLAGRVGPAQARMANMMLLTLRGTPTCYYGDEIGMNNVEIPVELIQDPPALRQPEIAHVVGRDPERTPMQWDASPNAGFAAADVRPWLPLADDYVEHNVAAQDADPTSMLSLFRSLTALRRAEPALVSGAYEPLAVDAPDLFAYVRRGEPGSGDSSFLVVLNFGTWPAAVDLSAVAERAEVVLETGLAQSGAVDLAKLSVAGDQGLVLRI